MINLNKITSALSSLSVLKQPRILISFFLAFSSGLPLALSNSTLKAWYATTSVSLVSIGFVGLAELPYALKFLWAPLMDRFVPPFLGRRRGWVLLCQLALCVFIGSMACFSPEENPKLLLALACIVAFLSASQDIAIDAYRVDLLKPEERAVGAAVTVSGFRIAMLVSGGLALILAHYFGWRVAYGSMALVLALGTLASFLGPEPEQMVMPPRRLWECTVQPFFDFLSRPQAITILFFIVFYKLGDAFAGALSQTYLIRKINMSLLEIGTLIKVLGFIATILGALWGGLWVPKLGWYRALFLFGIFQAFANLFYLPLLWTGPNMFVAGLAIFMDNLGGGMGTAAFLGLLMGLCNPRFSAFQYALLSALSVFGRVFISPVAGRIADTFGWEIYFMSSLLFALPGLLLLFWLGNDFKWSYAAVQSSTEQCGTRVGSDPVGSP